MAALLCAAAAPSVATTVSNTPTLVIVDMQGAYELGLYPQEVSKVVALVKFAIKHHFGVVNVRFDGDGETLADITELLSDYPHGEVVKSQWDGSEAVLQSCAQHILGTSRFILCGAYANMCVLATAQGLIERSPNAAVEIVQAACISSSGYADSNRLWKMISTKCPGVVLHPHLTALRRSLALPKPSRRAIIR